MVKKLEIYFADNINSNEIMQLSEELKEYIKEYLKSKDFILTIVL